VFDDADLDAAVQGDREQVPQHGQTCVCANRLLVQEGVYDAFVAKLVQACATCASATASPADRSGPLIDAKAVAKVEEHIADALAKGARSRSAASGTHSAARSSSRPSSPA